MYLCTVRPVTCHQYRRDRCTWASCQHDMRPDFAPVALVKDPRKGSEKRGLLPFSRLRQSRRGREKIEPLDCPETRSFRWAAVSTVQRVFGCDRDLHLQGQVVAVFVPLRWRPTDGRTAVALTLSQELEGAGRDLAAGPELSLAAGPGERQTRCIRHPRIPLPLDSPL